MKKPSAMIYGLLSFIFCGLFALQVGMPRLFAEEEIDEAFFYSVAQELRCPTCTGLSVLDSNASFSEQIKAQVRQQIQEGKNKQEILDFFVERYGLWILREPPKEGFNLLAWLLPTAILIFGPILIWFFVWRKRVQIESFGVRSVDSIVTEMNQQLDVLRGGKTL
ncbi:MAG: cytochrome c-type biogenesis protein [Oligoflexus sp.]